MKGNFVHSKQTVKAGMVTSLLLEDGAVFREACGKIPTNAGYSSDVWRVCMGRQGFYFHGIETFGRGVRPPKPPEVPRKTWLFYGSSITQGEGAFTYTDSFVFQTARALGVNALNLGLGGACLCEEAVADFIIGRNDWDGAVFEIGVNMRQEVTEENDDSHLQKCEKRLEYLLNGMAEKHPDKPVFLLTPCPNAMTYEPISTVKARFELAFGDFIRASAVRIRHPRLYLLEGGDLLTDFSTLTCDLVHPGPLGHTLIARNLTATIKKIMAEV
jgi:hypothetical protein